MHRDRKEEQKRTPMSSRSCQMNLWIGATPVVLSSTHFSSDRVGLPSEVGRILSEIQTRPQPLAAEALACMGRRGSSDFGNGNLSRIPFARTPIGRMLSAQQTASQQPADSGGTLQYQGLEGATPRPAYDSQTQPDSFGEPLALDTTLDTLPNDEPVPSAEPSPASLLESDDDDDGRDAAEPIVKLESEAAQPIVVAEAEEADEVGDGAAAVTQPAVVEAATPPRKGSIPDVPETSDEENGGDTVSAEDDEIYMMQQEEKLNQMKRRVEMIAKKIDARSTRRRVAVPKADASTAKVARSCFQTKSYPPYLA
eukprot:6550670-Pyramimonas_sp.AAC.2